MKIQVKANAKQRNLDDIAFAVGETVAQSFLLGADGFSGAVSSLFRMLEAMRGNDSTEAIAAALIEDTIAYAISSFVSELGSPAAPSKAEVSEFTRTSINKIRTICTQRDVYFSSRDVEYPSSNFLFEMTAKDAAYYFRPIKGKTAPVARAARFNDKIAEGLARISAKRPAYFSALWAALFDPSTFAADYSESWRRYRAQLIAQFEDQPIFGEETATGATIAQVYVPLRCWWGQGGNVAVTSARLNEIERRGYDSIYVSDLEHLTSSWLHTYDNKDRVRFVSGGPGSGKSTFAKKLASKLSSSSQWRVIFVPLQRLTGTDYLENRINSFFMREISGPFADGAPALSGLGLDSHKDWLFVFDGLDELAKEGGASESAAQDFASSLQDFMTRIPSKVHARFIVLGRAPSMQEARKRLNLGDGKTLYVADLLPYAKDRYTYTLAESVLRGDLELAALDQRADLWVRWAIAKGKDTKLPPAMSAPELEDITKEPLLAHLLIISGYVEDNWELAAENRNRIYKAIFEQIWIRESAKETRHDLNDLGEQIFYYLLQALGVAAWRGGGRTGDEFSFVEVRDNLLPTAVLKRISSNKNNNLANVALLFYTRKDEEGGHGYEFVHKSFGEYLTACAILDAFIRWGGQVADSNSDFDEEEFLARWIGLAGAAALTEEVYGFLKNQVRLLMSRGDDSLEVSRSYIKTLEVLIARVLKAGFPVRQNSVDYRQMEAKQNNAELILWAVLDCVARVAFPVETCRTVGESGWTPGPIDIPPLYSDQLVFERLLSRQLDVDGGSGVAFSEADQPEVVWMGRPNINRYLSRLRLDNVKIPFRYSEGFDFEGCSLNGASFYASKMFGCNFRSTNLIKSSFHHCEMMFVSFEGAILDDVSFMYVQFSDTVNFAVHSKKRMKTYKSKIKSNRSSKSILFQR